jgi:CRP-like cAMP-binding protein
LNRKIAFVNKGVLKSFITNPNGSTHIVAIAKEDYWVSDMHSIFAAEASKTTIQAVENAELFVFDYQILENLFPQIPSLEKHFRKLQQKRMLGSLIDRYNLISLNAEERYKLFIETQAEFHSRLPQKDIASYLGIFPESLSRIRRMLMDK